MAAPVQIIQLEPHDDVASVRDRLSFIESYRVLLVWPPGEHSILRRKLDLVLLQREAYRRAARLALVTQDEEVINNARDLNISTFLSIEASNKRRWKRGRSKVFVDRSDKPEGEPDPFELRQAATRRRRPRSRTQLAFRQIFRLMALLLVVAVLAGAAYVFLPTATVYITPLQEHLDVTVRIVADPNVQGADLENSVIPATILRVEIEESASFETTGSQDDAPTLATGTVVFTNQTTEAVTIPAGTTVNTSTGAIARFRTLEAVNIAGEVDAVAVAGIEALPQFAGPTGNVPESAINYIDGPLNEILTVQNINPTTGGDNPELRVVAQADHDRLTAAVIGAIQQRALGDLTPLLGAGQVILPETIRIAETRPEWTLFSAAVGQEADSVALNLRAIIQAAVIDERMMNQAAFAAMANRIPFGQVVVPNSITFSRGAIEQILDSGHVTFLANVEGDVTAEIDSEQIRQAIPGLNREEVIAYLRQSTSMDPASTPTVVIWPSFFERTPILPFRIQVLMREGT